jgi:hypothetical protein
MVLRGPQTRLDLTIVSGPDSEGWCRVSITLNTPAGRWSATTPCLTGQEIERLAGWLDATAEGDTVERLEFLEPELAFDAADGQVRVELRWGMRPRWAGGNLDEPFCVAVPVEPGQLRRAAEGLRSDLAQRLR